MMTPTIARNDFLLYDIKVYFKLLLPCVLWLFLSSIIFEFTFSSNWIGKQILDWLPFTLILLYQIKKLEYNDLKFAYARKRWEASFYCPACNIIFIDEDASSPGKFKEFLYRGTPEKS